MKEYPIHKRWRYPESPSLIGVIITNTFITLMLVLACTFYMHDELVQTCEDNANATNEIVGEINQLKRSVSEIRDDITTEYTTQIETTCLPETTAYSESTEQCIPLTELIDIWDYTSLDITNITNATEDDFNKMVSDIITYRDTENPDMQNIGSTLVEVEKTYGISGTAILSIITWESNFGDDCANINNLGGIRINDTYVAFNSVNECILYMGELLHTYVYSHELTEWEDIGERYCDYEWSAKIVKTLSSYNEGLNDIMYKNITHESIS